MVQIDRQAGVLSAFILKSRSGRLEVTSFQWHGFRPNLKIRVVYRYAVQCTHLIQNRKTVGRQKRQRRQYRYLHMYLCSQTVSTDMHLKIRTVDRYLPLRLPTGSPDTQEFLTQTGSAQSPRHIDRELIQVEASRLIFLNLGLKVEKTSPQTATVSRLQNGNVVKHRLFFKISNISLQATLQV